MSEDGIPKMKTPLFFVSVLCACFSIDTLAGWQVSQISAPGTNSNAQFIHYKDNAPITKPNKRTYRHHLRERGGVPAYDTSSASIERSSPKYAVSISGSLKENIEHIMHRYHWRVVWKAPYDYNFDGRVVGTSLPNVIDKLLQPFPLQAVMYMSNRTLAIVPRSTHA
jgi:hypothetical protein